MLVDLSGKVVHRGLLSALISSGCSLFPLSNSPADFRGVIMGRKHMDHRKMARRTRTPSLFQQIDFPDSRRHPVSILTVFSKKDLGITAYLTVGKFQVLDAGGILPSVG